MLNIRGINSVVPVVCTREELVEILRRTPSEKLALLGYLDAEKNVRVLTDAALQEEAREAGRREVLREIAKMPCDRSGQYEGSCWFCGHNLLPADGMFRDWESDNHEPSCLWLRAKALEPV